AALRLHLDELVLDRGDLRLERARAPTHASTGASLGTLLPPFDLRPKGADPVDRFVHLGELVADAHPQRELRVEVRLGRRNARVLANFEGGLVTLATDLETNAVLAGSRDRAGERRLSGFPCRVVLDTPGVEIDLSFLAGRLLDLAVRHDRRACHPVVLS